MMRFKKVTLEPDDCFCGLYDFYKNVAIKAGGVVTSSTAFDCRKINISEAVRNELWRFYREEDERSDYQISVLFLQMGPKVNVSAKDDIYIAEIETGFFIN